MKKIIFIGSTPPPYGGVTKKNEIILNFLAGLDIKKFKWFSFLISTLNKDASYIISISTKKMLYLTKFLNIFAQVQMKKSTVFAVGGLLGEEIGTKKKYIKILNRYKHVLVESRHLYSHLMDIGLKNVMFLENPRPLRTFKINIKPNKVPRFIFLSNVIREKGIELAIASFVSLNRNFIFDIYGPISKSYHKKLFEDNQYPNISYKGIFKGGFQELYKLLSEYDFLIFPTFWKGEGYPGILIESLISGVIPIASNHNYNSEIVIDGYNGFIIKNNTVEEISRLLKQIMNDKTLISMTKENALKSSINYLVENNRSMLTIKKYYSSL